MKLTDKIRSDAGKTITCTIDTIPLKNIALQICAAELKHNGFYTCVVDGVKTLFILEKH